MLLYFANVSQQQYDNKNKQVAFSCQKTQAKSYSRFLVRKHKQKATRVFLSENTSRRAK